MKKWLAKVRISAALDSGEPLPTGLRERITRSDELRAFEEQTASLHGALRKAQPQKDPPPWLHGWIMRGVRQSAIPRKQPAWPARLAWVGGAAVALSLTLLCWTIFTSRRPQPAEQNADAASLEAAAGALQLGNDMAHVAPVTLVAPLSNEMVQLNNDLNKTAEFLMASLP